MVDQGYAIHRQILDTFLLSKIRNDIIYIFNKQIQRLNIKEGSFNQNLFKLFKDHFEVYANCGKISQNSISIYELMTSPMINHILEHKCGIKDPIINTRPVVFMHSKHLAKDKENYITPVHRDMYTTAGSVGSVVFWIPLLDVPDSLGPLNIIPGSHLRPMKFSGWNHSFGVEDPSNYNDNEFIQLPAKVGDLITFDTRLIHKSGDNITEGMVRWSLSFRFSDLSCDSWLERNYEHPYTYRPNNEKPCIV